MQVQSLKEADIKAKGIIQIPEKILQSLQTSKGKLVIVKPVIASLRREEIVKAKTAQLKMMLQLTVALQHFRMVKRNCFRKLKCELRGNT